MSDLHITSDQSAPQTMLRTFDSHDHPTKSHIAGLKQLIADQHLTADLLLCPGDISDKADPGSLIFGWTVLHDIATALSARPPIATAGNHDMDSRHKYNEYDAKGVIQRLRPLFPGLDEGLCDRFWSRNFAIVNNGFWRLVVLNSSAYHGGGKDQPREAQHGRISPHTVEALREGLSVLPPAAINVLLCHHHLSRDNTISDADYSEMDGADALLQLLDCGMFGSWLVIHGHKHHPKLSYAEGGAASAVIFSAGSLSAELYPASVATWTFTNRLRSLISALRISSIEFRHHTQDLGRMEFGKRPFCAGANWMCLRSGPASLASSDRDLLHLIQRNLL